MDIQARIACGQRGGLIEIRQNSPSGNLIASFDVKYTGGWNNWKTIETDIITKIEGKTNLCVVFKGPHKVANLNWLKILE